jgi:3-oxoacyl-[acyl-carrier-protein] synthase II
MQNVLAALLGRAGWRPEDVGFVHAHGLSTRSCDIEEAQTIGRVFGARARPVPVVAAKSYFGNLGAGGGMVEFIAAVMALVHGRLFRVLNYDTPDPECPLAVVADGDRESGDSFMALGVSPQGQASATLVRRVAA